MSICLYFNSSCEVNGIHCNYNVSCKYIRCMVMLIKKKVFIPKNKWTDRQTCR